MYNLKGVNRNVNRTINRFSALETSFLFFFFFSKFIPLIVKVC